MRDPLPMRDTLIEALATGGHSTVFRAQDATGKVVAIKRSPCNPAQAQMLARVQAVLHPSLVPVHDVWTDAEYLYCAMPFYNSTLRQRLPHLSPGDVVKWSEQLAGGLATLHAAGIVHQDVTPANVLLDAADNAILTDFSISVPIGTRTAPAPAIGYCAPEQLLGGSITAQTDLYMLGMLLYEAASGAHPYAWLSAKQTMMHILHTPLAPLRGSAALLNDLILGLLAKNPHDRVYRATTQAK